MFSPWNWLIAFSLPPKELGSKGGEITHHTPTSALLPTRLRAGAPGTQPATHPPDKPSPRVCQTLSGPDPVLGPSWEPGLVPCPHPRGTPSQTRGGGQRHHQEIMARPDKPRAEGEAQNLTNHDLVIREGSLEEGRFSLLRPALGVGRASPIRGLAMGAEPGLREAGQMRAEPSSPSVAGDR